MATTNPSKSKVLKTKEIIENPWDNALSQPKINARSHIFLYKNHIRE